MKKVAITGGIGSGKSVIAAFLKTMGYPVYNSDEHSKRLLNENRDLREKLCAAFGKNLYKNKELDKAIFANLIFGDKKLLQTANAIIHPAVYQDFDYYVSKQTSDIVFVETALYFQSEGKKYIPFSILVQAPLKLRIQRVIQRDKFTEKEVLARIKNQIPNEKSEHLADFIILNDENHLLIPQVLHILEELKAQ